MNKIYKTLAEGIANRDRCPNCWGKSKVVVRVHNSDKIMECPICIGTGDIRGVKDETIQTTE